MNDLSLRGCVNAATLENPSVKASSDDDLTQEMEMSKDAEEYSCKKFHPRATSRHGRVECQAVNIHNDHHYFSSPSSSPSSSTESVPTKPPVQQQQPLARSTGRKKLLTTASRERLYLAILDHSSDGVLEKCAQEAIAHQFAIRATIVDFMWRHICKVVQNNCNDGNSILLTSPSRRTDFITISHSAVSKIRAAQQRNNLKSASAPATTTCSSTTCPAATLPILVQPRNGMPYSKQARDIMCQAILDRCCPTSGKLAPNALSEVAEQLHVNYATLHRVWACILVSVEQTGQVDPNYKPSGSGGVSTRRISDANEKKARRALQKVLAQRKRISTGTINSSNDSDSSDGRSPSLQKHEGFDDDATKGSSKNCSPNPTTGRRTSRKRKSTATVLSRKTSSTNSSMLLAPPLTSSALPVPPENTIELVLDPDEYQKFQQFPYAYLGVDPATVKLEIEVRNTEWLSQPPPPHL